MAYLQVGHRKEKECTELVLLPTDSFFGVIASSIFLWHALYSSCRKWAWVAVWKIDDKIYQRSFGFTWSIFRHGDPIRRFFSNLLRCLMLIGHMPFCHACLWSVGACSRGVYPSMQWGRPPLWTEWQTGAKILPCPKLRLRAVKIQLRMAVNLNLECRLFGNVAFNFWRIFLAQNITAFRVLKYDLTHRKKQQIGVMACSHCTGPGTRKGHHAGFPLFLCRQIPWFFPDFLRLFTKTF